MAVGVEDGRIHARNAAKESVTREELLAQLRMQGVESLDEVAVARMEGDGRISVIRKDGREPAHGSQTPAY